MVVANIDKFEQVVAPPGCGATVVYRVGYYNVLLPRTEHSEENLSFIIFME